jgi:hypothetical protein
MRTRIGRSIPFVLLAAAACGCNPCLDAALEEGWLPPAPSRFAFAGDYVDKEGWSSSLYRLLTGDEDLPPDPDGRFVTRLQPEQGDRFRIALLDGEKELRSTQIDMRFTKGYLDCGWRRRGEFYVLVGRLTESCAALGLNEQGDLVMYWQWSYAMFLGPLPISFGGPPGVLLFKRNA